MAAYERYPLTPGASVQGFAYGAITPLGKQADRGAGFLQGPDGSRAGLQWEVADAPYIMRAEAPSDANWGAYRVGFLQPVETVEDLIVNLEALLPRLRILYARMRAH